MNEHCDEMINYNMERGWNDESLLFYRRLSKSKLEPIENSSSFIRFSSLFPRGAEKTLLQR